MEEVDGGGDASADPIDYHPRHASCSCQRNNARGPELMCKLFHLDCFIYLSQEGGKEGRKEGRKAFMYNGTAARPLELWPCLRVPRHELGRQQALEEGEGGRGACSCAQG